MNKHTFDTMTTAALRDLDPAPTTVLIDEELERADATFARNLASPSHARVRAEPGRPRPRPRRPPRAAPFSRRLTRASGS
jgi:hypothetical protein